MSDAAFALFFADFSLSHNFLNVDAARKAWTKLSLPEREVWQSISDKTNTETRPAHLTTFSTGGTNSTPPKRDHYPRAHYDSTRTAVLPSSRPQESYSRRDRTGQWDVRAVDAVEDRNAIQGRQSTSSHPVLNQSAATIDDTDIPIPEIDSVEDFWKFVEPRN